MKYLLSYFLISLSVNCFSAGPIELGEIGSKNNLTTGYQRTWTFCKKGTLYYSDGSIKYTGDLCDRIPHGHGMRYFINGMSYEGQFRNGKAHGEGTLFQANGTIHYTGEWEDNKYNGLGIKYYTDGEVYEGNWKNSMKSGQGLLYYSNGGLKNVGSWKEGLLDGAGTIYPLEGDRYYHGNFSSGNKHGEGFYFDGEKHYSENWKNGKQVLKLGTTRSFLKDTVLSGKTIYILNSFDRDPKLSENNPTQNEPAYQESTNHLKIYQEFSNKYNMQIINYYGDDCYKNINSIVKDDKAAIIVWMGHGSRKGYLGNNNGESLPKEIFSQASHLKYVLLDCCYPALVANRYKTNDIQFFFWLHEGELLRRSDEKLSRLFLKKINKIEEHIKSSSLKRNFYETEKDYQNDSKREKKRIRR